MTGPPPRPGLRWVPLSVALPPLAGQLYITISVGQALTTLHRAAYAQGCFLLELDADEQPVRVYHRGELPDTVH